MYGLFALDKLSYGRIVTVDAALSQIVADRYCSYVFILMVSTPAKVIRRQVRRPTRPLQVEISLQKGFLAMISEVLIDGNKLVIAALSQIDVETGCP